VKILSHVVQLGGVPVVPLELQWERIAAIPDDAPLRCGDEDAQARMVALVDEKRREGDTLGGIFEVVARGVAPGLGSHTSWEEKLDGRLAQAVMSIPAVKAVAIGAGVEASAWPGSAVHDEIDYDGAARAFTRPTNRAGGLEGGITNGEELRVRGHLKPISTLRRALRSVDIDTKEPEAAAFERSDVTAVPAAGVIGEAMIALVLARAMREKFGGDSPHGDAPQLRRLSRTVARLLIAECGFRIRRDVFLIRNPHSAILQEPAMRRKRASTSM
jgi:chorismate synthase